MKTETHPSLPDLSAQLPTPPEGVSPAVALIADTQPRLLSQAVDTAINDHTHAYYDAQVKGHFADSADRMSEFDQSQLHEVGAFKADLLEDRQQHRAELAGRLQKTIELSSIVHGTVPSSEALDTLVSFQDESQAGLRPDELAYLDEKSARVDEAQAKAEAAQAIAEAGRAKVQALEPGAIFAKEITAAKARLSKPMRWATALICSAAVAAPLSVASYEVVKKSENIPVQVSTPDGGTKAVAGEKDNMPVIAGVGIGVLGGFGGSLIGSGIGSVLEGRFARRKAKKLVKKASEAKAA